MENKLKKSEIALNKLLSSLVVFIINLLLVTTLLNNNRNLKESNDAIYKELCNNSIDVIEVCDFCESIKGNLSKKWYNVAYNINGYKIDNLVMNFEKNLVAELELDESNLSKEDNLKDAMIINFIFSDDKEGFILSNDDNYIIVEGANNNSSLAQECKWATNDKEEIRFDAGGKAELGDYEIYLTSISVDENITDNDKTVVYIKDGNDTKILTSDMYVFEYIRRNEEKVMANKLAMIAISLLQIFTSVAVVINLMHYLNFKITDSKEK